MGGKSDPNREFRRVGGGGGGNCVSGLLGRVVYLGGPGISGEYGRGERISGRGGEYGRGDRISGKYGRADRISGVGGREEAISGEYGREDTISGEYGRGDRISGDWGREDELSAEDLSHENHDDDFDAATIGGSGGGYEALKLSAIANLGDPSFRIFLHLMTSS